MSLNNFINRNIVSIACDILEKAINKKASDIHIRDNNGILQLEYRVDGKLIQIKAIKILLY